MFTPFIHVRFGQGRLTTLASFALPSLIRCRSILQWNDGTGWCVNILLSTDINLKGYNRFRILRERTRTRTLSGTTEQLVQQLLAWPSFPVSFTTLPQRQTFVLRVFVVSLVKRLRTSLDEIQLGGGAERGAHRYKGVTLHNFSVSLHLL